MARSAKSKATRDSPKWLSRTTRLRPRLSVLVPPFSNFSPLYRVPCTVVPQRETTEKSIRRHHARDSLRLSPHSSLPPPNPTHSYRPLDRPNFKFSPVTILLYIFESTTGRRKIHRHPAPYPRRPIWRTSGSDPIISIDQT